MSQRQPPGSGSEVIGSLIELLAIAEVAMPDFLYDIDPRVQRALRLLAVLERASPSRPPSVARERPVEMVDLTPAPHPGQPTAPTPWDITEGLDAFMESPEAPATRTEAVVLILREWLTANGYLELPPAEEQQH
jgi:hypothetical protein